MGKEDIFDDLNKLKEDYEKLSKRYKLPSFDELAEEFDVERIVEKPSKFILRSVRRAINEKISAYLHLFETFMNPTNAPMLVLLMLKSSTECDKKEIEEIYRKLAKIEINSIKLDTIYSEKKEAEVISSIYSDWQKLKERILVIVERFDENFDLNSKSSTKGYFG